MSASLWHVGPFLFWSRFFALPNDLTTPTASELSSFTPDDIYPCSPACSTLREPCSSCLNSRPLTQSPSALAQPLECLLPRQPLRRILSHFLEAVRDRLIDDCSKCSKNNLNTPPVVRLKSGFLLSLHRATNEWGIGWEQYTSARFVRLH